MKFAVLVVAVALIASCAHGLHGNKQHGLRFRQRVGFFRDDSDSDGSSGNPTTKKEWLKAIPDKYQWGGKSDPTGMCGPDVTKLFTVCMPLIKAQLTEEKCNQLFPVLKDAFSTSPIDDFTKKVIDSWDVHSLKPDLYGTKDLSVGKCGNGTLLTPDNANKYHKDTGAAICSETVTVGKYCHSTHAVNYFYGGWLYKKCESFGFLWRQFSVGQKMFDAYMRKKDGAGTNWLKPAMTFWFACGYSDSTACFNYDKAVLPEFLKNMVDKGTEVYNNWYTGAKGDLTSICKPCNTPLTASIFTLGRTPKWKKCDANAGTLVNP